MTEKIYVNKHKNLLIIGKAFNNKNELSPTYEDNYEEVKAVYGADSQLTQAFWLAYRLGVPHIYLMNCQNHEDLFEIGDILDQYNFTYITPINILMSDTTYLQNNSGKQTTYISQIMSGLNRRHNSVFIMTDKHASLYEDVDEFIEDMNLVEQNFLRTRHKNLNRENIIFVANNIDRTQ